MMQQMNWGRSAAFMVLAGAAMAASAQKMDEFDFYASNLNLLQMKEIQQELKVTTAQRASLNKHADWFNAESKKLRDAIAKKKGGATNADQEQLNKLFADMKRRCFGVLNATQLRRVRQLSLQNAGPVVLLDEKVAKRVGLSQTQLKQLRDVFSANSKKASELQEKTFGPIVEKYRKMKPKDKKEEEKLGQAMNKEMEAASKKIQPQISTFANSTRQTMDKVLTAQQKQAFQALLGPAFNLPAPPKQAPPK
jgi:hypothetical protein